MNNQIAVYGTLRKGFGNHSLLANKDTEYLGRCKTEPKFTMKSLGMFPGVYENGGTSITVEVYKINDDVFKRVDGLEGFPTFYDRQEINTEFGKAWMYFLKGKTNHPIVTSGDWTKK